MADIDKVVRELTETRSLLADVNESLDKALRALGEAVEDPEDQPDDDGNTGYPRWLLDIIGGKPGSNGRQLVQDKKLRGTLRLTEGTDYYRCDLGGTNARVINGPVPPRVRLIDCTVAGVRLDQGDHVFYINQGKGRELEDSGFVCIGLGVEDCAATNLFECKGMNPTIVGTEQAKSCKIPQTIRLRHGKGLICVDNKGFTQISARGYQHWVEDNAGADCVTWSGNISPKWEIAKNEHDAGSGNNMQGTETCYFAGVASVVVGLLRGDHGKYPAKDIVVDPDVPKVVEGNFRNLQRRKLRSLDELKALAS